MELFEIKKVGAKYITELFGFSLEFSSFRVSEEISALVKVAKGDRIFLFSRLDLANSKQIYGLAKRINDIDGTDAGAWIKMLTFLFGKLVDELVKYTEPQRLTKDAGIEPYYIYPLLSNDITLVFAPGGSGKSFLALHLAVAVQNGLDDAVIITNGTKDNVLYADWETDSVTMAHRFGQLVGDRELEAPLYRQMVLPFEYHFDTLLEDISRYNVKLLIIDSASPAIGGNINEATAVGHFFSLLRQFVAMGVKVLILTHVSKRDDDKSTPIGSVYFMNFPRLVWSVEPIRISNKLVMDLTPVKFNIPRPPRVEYEFVFGEQVNVDGRILEGEPTDEVVQAIISFVLEKGETRMKEINNYVRREFGLTDAYKIVQKLTKEGKLKQVRFGVYATVNDDEIPF